MKQQYNIRGFSLRQKRDYMKTKLEAEPQLTPSTVHNQKVGQAYTDTTLEQQAYMEAMYLEKT